MDKELEGITGINGDATFLREAIDSHIEWLVDGYYPGDVAQALEELAEEWRGYEDEYAEELAGREEED